MKTRSFIFGLFIILFLSPTTVYAQEGCAISSYLVGTYDMTKSNTILQIINPTYATLKVCVAFYDASGHPITGLPFFELKSNGLRQVNVKDETLHLEPKPIGFGAIKIISYDSERKKFTPVVGFQQHYFKSPMSITESILASVPGNIPDTDKELDKIWGVCK